MVKRKHDRTSFERGVALGLMLARGETLTTATIRERFGVSQAQAKRDMLAVEWQAHGCCVEVRDRRQVALQMSAPMASAGEQG